MNALNKAEFLLSVAKIEQLPPDKGREVVLAGYSNVGKSSTLNAITAQRQLARVSKTPGRTQCLNVFTVGEHSRLVDLPGFGYAKVPEKILAQWHQTIDRYLTTRQCLYGVVLIMDIRNLLRSFEVDMIEWAMQSNLQLHLVLNKKDKLKKMQVKEAQMKVQRFLDQHQYSASLQTISTLKGDGIGELSEIITTWLQHN